MKKTNNIAVSVLFEILFAIGLIGMLILFIWMVFLLV